MNASKLTAAAVLLIAAASAFAADAPAGDATAAATSAASSDMPSVNISRSAGRTRAEAYAEAVEFVKNHKTALAIQLEQYKN